MAPKLQGVKSKQELPGTLALHGPFHHLFLVPHTVHFTEIRKSTTTLLKNLQTDVWNEPTMVYKCLPYFQPGKSLGCAHITLWG